MTSLDPLYTIGNQIDRADPPPPRPDAAEAQARGARAAASWCSIPDPERRHRLLSARTLRRPAPARDDRHGAGQRSRHPDRRRADDRARRHHPGADPRRCSPICRRGSAWRSSSSPTTSASSGASPTASMSCAAARSWRAATTEAIFAAPQHDYTQMLLAAEPGGGKAPPPAGAPILLEGRDVTVTFAIGGGFLAGRRWSCGPSTASRWRCAQARPSASSANSGSGKSTLGRALLRLLPQQGRDPFRRPGHLAARPRAMRPLRRAAAARLPGPLRLAVAAHDRRRRSSPKGCCVHEPSLSPARARPARRRGAARGRRSIRPRATATRTSSPAASASASPSPAPSS